MIVIVFLSTISMAQSLRRPGERHREYRAQLLEPLIPFSEAVEKARAGNPQGWYALAIHYEKGEEVDRDQRKARKFIQKASDMGYSNAVFIAAMMLEAESTTAKDCGGSRSRPCVAPRINDYLEGTEFPIWSNSPTRSITNAVDVAAIRAGYERAISLGVSAATNELARFERRVSSAQEEAKKKADVEKRKAENAKLAEGLDAVSTASKIQ